MKFDKHLTACAVSLIVASCTSTPNLIVPDSAFPRLTNVAVDTAQKSCFNSVELIECPQSGEYVGQDAQYEGHSQNYTVHGNGTVTDNVSGLIWTQSPDTNGDSEISKADKLSSSDAAAYCESLTLAGYDDWQLPNIKQAYSLINFQGEDPDPMARGTSELTPL